MLFSLLPFEHAFRRPVGTTLPLRYETLGVFFVDVPGEWSRDSRMPAAAQQAPDP
jgi:hypothetical protein